MVQIVVIKNPFQPGNGREIHQVGYEPGKQVSYYTELYRPIGIEPDDLLYVVNGYVVDKEKELFDGAFVVISPIIAKGHKNPLLIVASIALSVVAMGVGGLVATGHFMSFAGATAWGAIAGYTTAAAIMFCGGSLISHWAGGDKLGYGGDKSENPTYSWSGITTSEGQGNAIPITYGTVKSGGQTLNKFITSDSDKQYLSWLIAAGEGPLDISDIEINKNPASYFKNVQVDTRRGTFDQSVIRNFNDTISTEQTGMELLEDSWRTYDVHGSATRGIVVDLECSNGLYHVKNNGNLENAWINVEIQYKKADSTTWQNFTKNVEENQYGISLINNGAYTGNHSFSIQYGIFNLIKFTIDDIKKLVRFTDIGKDLIYVGDFVINTSLWSQSLKDRVQKGEVISDTIVVLEGTQTGHIEAAKASAVRRQFRIDYLDEGEYTVRIKVTSRQYPTTSTRAATRIWWSSIGSIVYDDFSYPGIAMIGVKALATDQLSGSPSITFLKSRSHVAVYNPSTSKYEYKDATNPAWAAYDYIHRAIDLYGDLSTVFVDGAPAELMMYDRFADWAEWCDKKDLKINIEINTAGDLMETVNSSIAPIGHGRVVLFGIRFGCVYDAPVDAPVQMFTMGNIIAGSFEEEFSQTSDRANAVEITFNNKDKEYDRDTITVYGADYDAADSYNNVTAITVNGITDYKQAYRYGKYQLACNQRLVRTCKFKAAIDAIACTAGDVISIAHDVPEWACSGHIIAADGDTVTLNAIFDNYDSTAEYRLQYRATKSDSLYTADISSISIDAVGVHVKLKAIPDENPSVGDVADIAKKSIGSKLFTVKTITRSNDGQYIRTITALEYSAAVFDENYAVPDINYSMAAAATGDVSNVMNLNGNQLVWMDSGGVRHSRLYLTWQYPDGQPYQRFDVFLSSGNNGYYQLAGSTTTMYFETDTAVGQEYYVKVVTVGTVRTSSGTITKVAAGLDSKPPDIKSLNVEKMSSGLRRYWWDFTYPEPNDIAGFKMKYIQGTILNWDNGIPVQDGLITSQPYETQTVRQGIHAVMIKAVDNAGNESQNFAYCLLDMGDLLEQNILYQKDYAVNQWSDVIHNGYLEPDGFLYPVNTINMWNSASNLRWEKQDIYVWENNWQPYMVSTEFTAPVGGQMWLKYDIEGPAIVYYREILETSAWDSNDSPAWSDADENSWELDEEKIWKQYSDRINIKAGDELQIKIVALNNNNEKTIVKALTVYIDVPDRNEHFEDLTIPINGCELPIVTPHYHTTAVRIDAVQGDSSGTVLQPIIISRNPCVVKLVNQNGETVSGTVDISWQGYVEEVL